MSLGAPRTVLVSDPDEVDRKIYFDLRQEVNPLAPALGESGGQPQISTNFGTYTNTGIGTLTHTGNGRYEALITVAAVGTVGSLIRTRFKSANTVETPGDFLYVVPNDPGADNNAAIAALVVDLLSGSPGVVVLPTTSQQITLSQAMVVARAAIHEEGVSDGHLDDALREVIRVVVSDYLNRTRINSTEQTVSAIVGNPLLDMSGVAGFRAERFIHAQIDFNQPLKPVSYEEISRNLDSSSANGEPDSIAFNAATTAYLSPRPEATSTIKVKYALAGPELAADTDFIPVPGEYIKPVLWFGVPAFLRNAHQKGDMGNASWQKYITAVRSTMGFGESNIGTYKPDLTDFN